MFRVFERRDFSLLNLLLQFITDIYLIVDLETGSTLYWVASRFSQLHRLVGFLFVFNGLEINTLITEFYLNVRVSIANTKIEGRTLHFVLLPVCCAKEDQSTVGRESDETSSEDTVDKIVECFQTASRLVEPSFQCCHSEDSTKKFRSSSVKTCCRNLVYKHMRRFYDVTI